MLYSLSVPQITSIIRIHHEIGSIETSCLFLNKLKGSSTKGLEPQLDEGQFIKAIRKYVELAERKEEDTFPHSDNDELNELLTRLSSVLHKREDYYKVRLNMITEAIEIGLWEMDVFAGDPVNPCNEFRWSNELRRMIGYTDEHDFPNLLSSWSNQLHPDDLEPTLTAFANHLNDYTGQTDYNLKYRLQSKNGEYRWYQAVKRFVMNKVYH